MYVVVVCDVRVIAEGLLGVRPDLLSELGDDWSCPSGLDRSRPVLNELRRYGTVGYLVLGGRRGGKGGGWPGLTLRGEL